MRGDGQQIRSEGLHVDLDVWGGLDCIDMEQHALVRADPPAQLGHGLDGANLVVGQHDTHQDRLVGDCCVDVVGVHPAVAVNRQLDDLEPELLQVAQRVADGVMLDARGDDPVAARLARPGGTLEGQVVGLRPARGENDLARLGVHQPGHSLVRVIQRSSRLPAERMGRTRVAEAIGQEREHRVEDIAPQRGRRSVVEIDRHGAGLYAGSLDRRSARHSGCWLT